MKPIKPKEIVLNKIRLEVDNISDKLGMSIDEGVKETVVYLRALGFPTSQSCEGHLFDDEKEVRLSPFVEIYPKEPNQKNWTNMYELREKVVLESKSLFKKAKALLMDYYDENPVTNPSTVRELW